MLSPCCGGGKGLSLPAELKNLFDPPYTAGVRVHSNSWGCVHNPANLKEIPGFHMSVVASCVSPTTGQECNLYTYQARQIDR